ncbi:MAG: lasso peptide biosynthesis protein, partial [Actinomycetota bacterium]|nr:lasso peptide biosynthesis protein [Actinomycetota bacterium]
MRRLRLALEIIWAYVIVRFSLRRRGAARTLDSVRRRPGIALPLDGYSSLATAMRLGRGVQKTLGVLPLDSRCLIRSLVLTRLLARRGLDSTVVFAARSKPH